MQNKPCASRFDTKPKCGEIWMCNLPEKEGSIQGGYRPVFVLSNNKNNTYSSTINIIPMTTKMKKRNLPVHVEIWNHKDCGLKAPSILLVEQITTIPSDCFEKCIGKILDKTVIDDINRAIRVQFPILCV